jgi:hypothetical protein
MIEACSHLNQIRRVKPRTRGCEDALKSEMTGWIIQWISKGAVLFSQIDIRKTARSAYCPSASQRDRRCLFREREDTEFTLRVSPERRNTVELPTSPTTSRPLVAACAKALPSA